MTIQKSDLKKIIYQSKPKDAIEKIGQWEKEKAINVVARTLWMEARGEGDIGLNMVMTVIWNRAGGNPEHLVEKCLERKQFSCWNNISNKTPRTYSIKFPKSALAGKECSTWNKSRIWVITNPNRVFILAKRTPNKGFKAIIKDSSRPSFKSFANNRRTRKNTAYTAIKFNKIIYFHLCHLLFDMHILYHKIYVKVKWEFEKKIVPRGTNVKNSQQVQLKGHSLQ